MKPAYLLATLVLTGCGAASASAPASVSRCTSPSTFSVPGATNTFASLLSASGEVAGVYADATGTPGAFIMDACGTITTFAVPGASGTTPQFINAEGDVAGTYATGTSGQHINHVFVRSWTGSIAQPEFPNENLIQGGAVLYGFNDAGSVVGSYLDAGNVWHGFLRDTFGKITTYLPDSAASATVNAINAAGEIAGSYIDSTKLSHGFVVTP